MDEAKKATPRPATEADWGKLRPFTHWPVVCCLWDLRRRVKALEAAGGVAGNPGHASAAPAGVSVDELADCLPANAWAGPEGYSRQAFARHLLDHSRIGRLLRGEGAAAPGRVEQIQEPTHSQYFSSYHAIAGEVLKVLADAARAEAERQQQGGQADV